MEMDLLSLSRLRERCSYTGIATPPGCPSDRLHVRPYHFTAKSVKDLHHTQSTCSWHVEEEHESYWYSPNKSKHK